MTYSPATGRLAVTATDPVLSLSLFQVNDTGCEPFCDSRLDLRSAQGFQPSPNCTDPVGDATFIQCRPVPATTEVRGSPGADTVAAAGGGAVACPDPTVRVVGLAGPDDLRSGCANDRLDGGDGRDTIDGGGGADELIGGAEADVLDGGAGTDALHGGDGRDLFIPGTGADVISGGSSVDTVSFEDRANPVSVTIGGVADDGERGEGDTVAEDVENIVAGAGADTVSGSGAANDIDAGPGNDGINPGGGADIVEAGDGDDAIAARDGVQDRVVCGAGTDRVSADAFDTLDGCEQADVSRELMGDIDNDGVAAPIDCDDRDPLRRPALADLPENGRDEDCVAGDALFPRVLATLVASFDRVGTRVRPARLVARDVPDTATIEIRCSGRKCFRGTRRRAFPNGSRRVNLKRHVRGLRLRRGAVLEVRILRPQTIGRVWRNTVRRRARVVPTVSCLRPGATKPAACPRS